MPGDLEPGAPLDRRGGRLDEAAGDGRDRPAALASNVLVVLAGSLDAGLPVAEVDPNTANNSTTATIVTVAPLAIPAMSNAMLLLIALVLPVIALLRIRS